MMAGRGSIIVARLGLALRVPHFEEKPHATRGYMVNYKISTFCFRAKSGARSGGERKEKFAARKSECLAAGPMMLHRFAGATKPVCSEHKKAPDHPPAAFGLRSSVAG